MRAIPGIGVDRAKLRTTLVHRVTPDLQAGLEYNPLGDDLGLIANWRLVDETDTRPALIVGTSSDRIGTVDGRAVYATLSKDLEGVTGLPLAPYAGLAWGESDHQLRGIGGLVVRWSERVSSTHLHDGVHEHHLLNWRYDDRGTVGLVLVEQPGSHFVGVSWSLAFGLGQGE